MKWFRRQNPEREILKRIYSMLAELDVTAQSTKGLIAGVHALRWQVRGSYYGLYGRFPQEREWEWGRDATAEDEQPPAGEER